MNKNAFCDECLRRWRAKERQKECYDWFKLQSELKENVLENICAPHHNQKLQFTIYLSFSIKSYQWIRWKTNDVYFHFFSVFLYLSIFVGCECVILIWIILEVHSVISRFSVLRYQAKKAIKTINTEKYNIKQQ